MVQFFDLTFAVAQLAIFLRFQFGFLGFFLRYSYSNRRYYYFF